MIARTIEVDAELTPNIVEADAELNDRTIEADAEMITTIEHAYVEGGSLPRGGIAGDVLLKRSDGDYDAEWVAPATSVEQDNTRPITAGAVYTEIGNINALLATI